ncbi:MAG: hypothetical protein RL762_454 [Bacteroidota bacterium]|jgi:hypothetical protein
MWSLVMIAITQFLRTPLALINFTPVSKAFFKYPTKKHVKSS